jgi:primosomal protein N' (replication factor Y)
MDLDTTRSKNAYHKILGDFENRQIDILVGTQMISKGLDFDNVSLVGILNADTMLNFPDFRAHERAYQMMVQVSGRAGRNKKQGNVAIQTYNPYHQILQQVSTHSFEEMYKEQLNERWQYKYPPYYRTIKIIIKHKNYTTLNDGAQWLGTSFSNVFKENVLGPAVPPISKIRNLYIQHFIIKIPPKQSIIKTKEVINRIKNTFQAVKLFRSIKFIIDVDNY